MNNMKIKFLLSILLLTSITAFCKTWTVVNSGSTFNLATITITEGDSVIFVLAGSHNAREVSQATWNIPGSTALSGGFEISFGGGTVLPAKLTVGTHYYVCANHFGSGMKGQIIVQSAVGIVENASANISVYPNPANDLVTVKTGRNLLGSSYFMYDLTGRQVFSGKIMNENTSFDISQLQSGVYFLQITNAKQTFKVIKN
jgi:plastocyanin